MDLVYIVHLVQFPLLIVELTRWHKFLSFRDLQSLELPESKGVIQLRESKASGGYG